VFEKKLVINKEENKQVTNVFSSPFHGEMDYSSLKDYTWNQVKLSTFLHDFDTVIISTFLHSIYSKTIETNFILIFFILMSTC
jgi:hypothetical protein